ncbi:hypothetical protein [Rhodococcus chondri]|uniref:Integral membrane protein n=1 Tax=Rhodococcus chondri TaxID=3065941 RepID=A0ABU7JQP2_9NOCA|nr:hypothetical protein [Rhodococcus sp. CC-R104]MEE2032348.1 hypothetical protein [Rhodococcus sp. CC-R104]
MTPSPTDLETQDPPSISGATSRTRTLVRAATAGVITLLMVGVPTDILANPWFGREIPVRWWEYPVLAATAVLTAMWFGIQSSRPTESRAAPAAGVLLTVFAVGCPVCNKLVLVTIGASGALGWWAPLQPILAVLSLAMLAGAVLYRWRRRPCGDSCAPSAAPLTR